MNAWKRVGRLLAVALVLLGPAAALACSLLPPEPWTLRTADGRFELSMKREGHSSGASLTLHDRQTDKAVWQLASAPAVYRGEAFVSVDGRYVVLVQSFQGTVVAYGPEGKKIGAWSLGAQLTPSERRRLSQDICGSRWVAEPRLEGDVFTLRVPSRASMHAPTTPPDSAFQGVRFRIELSTGRLTRDAPLAPPSNAALIQAFRRESNKLERFSIARELHFRSQEAIRGDAPELSRFWLETLRAPDTEGELFPVATQALGSVGTDEEIRGLADISLPAEAEESSRALFSLLVWRLPEEESVRFALSVLQERRPPEHLRERALEVLRRRSEDAFDRVLMFVLRDPSPRVREAALLELEKLGKRGASRRNFELALPLLEDPKEPVRQAAEKALCGMLRLLEGSDFQAARDQAHRAGAEVKLGRCSR